MNTHQLAANYFFLNALVALNKSMEIRTAVYSKMNLDSLLTKRPAAITFSRPGVLDAERLLHGYLTHGALFRPITLSTRVRNWRCYSQRPDDLRFEFKELLDSAALTQKVAALVKQASQASEEAPICALVPDILWTSEHEDKICSTLRDIVDQSRTSDKPVVLEAKSLPESAIGLDPSSNTAHNGDESNDRGALIRIRREMLDKVGSFSSEDLAAAAKSTTSNPSQFAADQRNTGEIFGVRFGREWRYPKFQFDSARRPLQEIKPILEALSPDDQGWDRLQWFLEPHEALGGRTPLEIWRKDRQKVVAAARTERWDGRD